MEATEELGVAPALDEDEAAWEAAKSLMSELEVENMRGGAGGGSGAPKKKKGGKKKKR